MVFGLDDFILLGGVFPLLRAQVATLLNEPGSDAILILSPLLALYIRGKLPLLLSLCISVSFGGLYVSRAVVVGTLIKLVYKASCGHEVELLFMRRSVDECFEFVRAEDFSATMVQCYLPHLPAIPN